nr:thioredoxin domain-containing protein [Bacillus cereus]
MVLVGFWAKWCGPCKRLSTVLEEFDTEMKGKIKGVKIDIDKNKKTFHNFKVMSIPALFVLKDGQVVYRALGFRYKEALVELVSKQF